MSSNPTPDQVFASLGIKRQSPSSPPRRPKRDWEVLVNAAALVPGEWLLVASDVPVSTSAYVRRRYGDRVQVLLNGTDSVARRAEDLYLRHYTDAELAERTEAELNRKFELALAESDYERAFLTNGVERFGVIRA